MMLTLLMIYAGIFIIILLCSFAYKVKENITSKSIDKKVKYYVELEKELYNGKDINEHLNFLCKSLKSRNNIIAYELAIDELLKENKYTKYVIQEINAISPYINRHSLLVKTYYAFIISYLSVNDLGVNNNVKEFLKKLMKSKSLYARENAIAALFKVGEENDVLQSLASLNKSKYMINSKLLAEHLNKYNGSKKELAYKLLDNFDNYELEIKVAIINFFRLSSIEVPNHLHSKLNPNENEEIIYATLRYFGKYKLDKAENKIIRIGKMAISDENWNLVSVVASTLGIYRSNDSTEFLKIAITSSDYNARLNAASSLVKQYKDQAIEIVEPLKDKYALESVQYQLSSMKEGD